MAQLLANTLEGGTNGAAVTVGNSGGSSGDAFSNVIIGTGSSVLYDNTHSAHGAIAAMFTTGASAVSAAVEYDFAAATTTIAFRISCYFTSLPASTLTLFNARSGSTTRIRIGVNNARKVGIFSSTGTQLALCTSALALNSFVRIEVTMVLSATVGSCTVNRYDSLDSSVASETISVSGQNFGGSADNCRIGNPVGIANTGPFWLDDIAVNDTGVLIGPVVRTNAATGNVALSTTSLPFPIKSKSGTSLVSLTSSSLVNSLKNSGSTISTTLSTSSLADSIRSSSRTANMSLNGSGVNNSVRSNNNAASVSLSISALAKSIRSGSRTSEMLLDTSGISSTLRINGASALIVLSGSTPSTAHIRDASGVGLVALSTSAVSTTIRSRSLSTQQALLTASGLSSALKNSTGSTNAISISASGVSLTSRINNAIAVVYLTTSGIYRAFINRDVDLTFNIVLGRAIAIETRLGRSFSTNIKPDRWKVGLTND